MRRTILTLQQKIVLTLIVMLCLTSLGGMVVFAQDSTATPETPVDADALLLKAETLLTDTKELKDLAFDLLGIFEAVSVAITLLGAGLGVIGFGRLLSAENSLTKAREDVQKEIEVIRSQFEDEIEKRRHEFETLRDDVTAITEQQRKEVANATLATALLSFGERQYRASDYVGAVSTYKRALELDDNNPVTYYRLGYVYNSQGNLDEAESHFIRSLEIDNAFAPAIVALGFVFRRKGEQMEAGIDRDQMFNRAEQEMLRGLKISPKLVDEDGESWWGALGGLYRRREQTAQAIAAYEQATAVTPHSSYPFGNLARLYGAENNIEGMLRMYQRVEKLAFAEVQAEVDNYWGYFDLLTAQLTLGHREKAEESLPSVLETVPSDAVYALDSLVNTLRGVARTMEGYDQADMLLEFAQRIANYARKRRENPDLNMVALRPEDTMAQPPSTEDTDSSDKGDDDDGGKGIESVQSTEQKPEDIVD